ncbi:hypothetical protein MSG28_002683 [Choristoneura fumiferana]|uniref:Uncharacterized protein n=1 Tax=Choristoneura fumiferana TaxID=7141 RepID=A0ACC0JIV5_CHOFU|nr:hypothetical protein MSG28_002683 [Choristoneura fumiferana]
MLLFFRFLTIYDDPACFWTLTILALFVTLARYKTPTATHFLVDLRMQTWIWKFGLLFLILVTMSGKKCCVPNCDKSRADDVILHVFPNPDKDFNRFNTWTNAIGGHVSSLNPHTVFDCRRVCHLHFEPRYHTRSKRLSPNAVPTLHLSGFSIERRPLRDITVQESNDNDNMRRHQQDSILMTKFKKWLLTIIRKDVKNK